MAKAKILPRESDLYAILTGFQDVKDSANYPADATVTCTIVDAAEAPVTNGANIAMPYIVGTSGADTEYRGVVPSTVTLVKNTSYTGKIVAVKAGAKHTFRVDFTAGG